MRDLAVLLARPGQAVPALELVEAAGGPPAAAAAAADLGPVLDATARRAYRERLAELDGELAEAEANADLGRLERLRAERSMLAAELAGALGLGGRARFAGDPAERARKAVTMRIRAAISAIGRRTRPLPGTCATPSAPAGCAATSRKKPVSWRSLTMSAPELTPPCRIPRRRDRGDRDDDDRHRPAPAPAEATGRAGSSAPGSGPAELCTAYLGIHLGLYRALADAAGDRGGAGRTHRLRRAVPARVAAGAGHRRAADRRRRRPGDRPVRAGRGHLRGAGGRDRAGLPRRPGRRRGRSRAGCCPCWPTPTAPARACRTPPTARTGSARSRRSTGRRS